MSTMKVVAVTGPRQCELVEKPMPKAGADIAVVRIHAAPMCTEYGAYKNGAPNDCLGHEAAGEVVEVAQKGKVKVGDRVVVMPQYPCGVCALCLAGDYIYCQNCVDPLEICDCEAGKATYADHMIKQDWLLLPIPDDVSYEHGGMACCGLGPTFGASEIMNIGAFDTVLVTGLGPVGLGGVINATARGARVIGVESHPYRANLALELGAERVIDPNDEDALAQIKDMTGGVGVDKAMDCSGKPAAQRLMIDAARCRGHICFIGEGGSLDIKVSNDTIRKGLVLEGIWHWNLGLAPKMMDLIRRSKDKLDRVITHTFPLSAVGEAWELQLTGESGKVILKP